MYLKTTNTTINQVITTFIWILNLAPPTIIKTTHTKAIILNLTNLNKSKIIREAQHEFNNINDCNKVTIITEVDVRGDKKEILVDKGVECEDWWDDWDGGLLGVEVLV